MIISKRNLGLYNKRMEEISNNIWEIFDNYEYYKMIRGIMNQYFNNQELTKRQTIRLYEFIYDLPQETCSKETINQLYKIARDDLEAE